MLFTQLTISKDKVFTSACSLPVRKDFSVVFCTMPILDCILCLGLYFCLSNSYLVLNTPMCNSNFSLED